MVGVVVVGLIDPERSIGDTGLGKDVVSGFCRLARSLSIKPMARVFALVIVFVLSVAMNFHRSGIGGTGGGILYGGTPEGSVPDDAWEYADVGLSSEADGGADLWPTPAASSSAGEVVASSSSITPRGWNWGMTSFGRVTFDVLAGLGAPKNAVLSWIGSSATELALSLPSRDAVESGRSN
jgi:hypothetical protein